MANATARPTVPTRPMKIGELSAVVGTDAPTIRYYEAEGVLPQPARTGAGYRMYTDADADRVRFVKHARALGLSLAEVRDIASAREVGSPPCSHVRGLLSRQIANTKQQISELAILLGELETLEAMSRSLPDEPSPDEACICHAIETAPLAGSPGASKTKGT